MSLDRDVIGIVLSNSTTSFSSMQIFRDAESFVKSGILVKIKIDQNSYIIARVAGIKYIHKYLEEGDIFSFARGDRDVINKYRSVIREHGLSYSTAKLELLYQIRRGQKGIKRDTITLPPRPGSWVYKISERDILELAFSGAPPADAETLMDEGRSGKIGFGYMYGYERKAPFIIDLDNITMHMAVIGTTGSGKSYTTGYFLEQVSRIFAKNGGVSFTGVPVLVFDANGDYLDYMDDPKYYLPGYSEFYLFRTSRSERISGNTVVSPSAIVLEPTVDFNDYSPDELARIAVLYHKGFIEGADQQINILAKIIDALKDSGITMNDILLRNLVGKLIEVFEANNSSINTRNAASILGRDVDDRISPRYAKTIYQGLKQAHPSTRGAILRTINTFVEDIKKFGILNSSPKLDSSFFTKATDPRDPAFILFDFSSEGMPGIPLKIKQLLVYHVLSSLYRVFTKFKLEGKQRVMIVGIEEAHNYAPNSYTYPISFSIAKDSLALIATQGRKFGISLLVISQRPIYVDPIVMSMINTWVIHRISPADVDFVLRTSGGLPQYMARKLVKLEKGTAIVTGQMNTLRFPVLVSFEDLRRAPHRAGTFNLEQVFQTEERGGSEQEQS